MIAVSKKHISKQTICTPTLKNIVRQDVVDNKVFEFINELLPVNNKISWDIEVIATVRDSIFSAVSQKVGGQNESKFYP